MTPYLNLYLSHDNPRRSVTVEARLRDSLHDLSADIVIKSGRGDANNAWGESTWEPSQYDLIILMVSAPEREREPNNWYQLQSELQKIETDVYDKSRQKTLMYIQKNTLDVARDLLPDLLYPARKVLNNITERGSWAEYESDSHLCELIKGEIIHFIDEKTAEPDEGSLKTSQGVDGSWRITLDQAVQTKIGARWVERGDHLAIDASVTESDSNVAGELITSQLHENIKHKAQEIFADCNKAE